MGSESDSTSEDVDTNGTVTIDSTVSVTPPVIEVAAEDTESPNMDVGPKASEESGGKSLRTGLHSLVERLNVSAYLILAVSILTIVPGAIAVYESFHNWYIEEYEPCYADFTRDDDGTARSLEGIPLAKYAGDDTAANALMAMLTPIASADEGRNTDADSQQYWFSPEFTREVKISNNLDRDVFVKRIRVVLKDVEMIRVPYLLLEMRENTVQTSISVCEDKRIVTVRHSYDVSVINAGLSDVNGLTVCLSNKEQVGRKTKLPTTQGDDDAFEINLEMGDVRAMGRAWASLESADRDYHELLTQDGYIFIHDVKAYDDHGREICVLEKNVPFQISSDETNSTTAIETTGKQFAQLSDTGGSMPATGVVLETEDPTQSTSDNTVVSSGRTISGDEATERMPETVGEDAISSKSSKASSVYELPVSLMVAPNEDVVLPLAFFPDFFCSGQMRVMFEVTSGDREPLFVTTDYVPFAFDFDEDTHRLSRFEMPHMTLSDLLSVE